MWCVLVWWIRSGEATCDRITCKEGLEEWRRMGVYARRRRHTSFSTVSCFFFQAEDGIRALVRSRGLGDVYKRQQL